MVLGVEGLKNNLCDGRDVKLDAIPSSNPGGHVQKSVLNSQVDIHKDCTSRISVSFVDIHLLILNYYFNTCQRYIGTSDTDSFTVTTHRPMDISPKSPPRQIVICSLRVPSQKAQIM